ncbi:MAG: phosphoribosylaminoimidazolesuccinocarboxamide synthase [Acidimicrobiales bacterium]|jgi:phosphoribosylaminoimidazole-succinocarboxamide synthase
MAPTPITLTDFALPGLKGLSRADARDVYTIGDKYLVTVETDRISAFDFPLPVAIPFKGQILNQIATYFLKQTEDIAPSWFLSSPDPNVVIGYQCAPYRIEMVIHGFLVGHLWSQYEAGDRTLCGVTLPDGLKESDRLDLPLITATAHADHGHEGDISADEIVSEGMIPAEVYPRIEHLTRRLYERGSEIAKLNGLILVDARYSFGTHDGDLCLVDEVHTPDCARYFFAGGYEVRQARGERQRELSTEFVREWLITHGFQGSEGQSVPVIPAEFVESVSERYIELFERLTGRPFSRPSEAEDPLGRIESNTRKALEALL